MKKNTKEKIFTSARMKEVMNEKGVIFNSPESENYSIVKQKTPREFHPQSKKKEKMMKISIKSLKKI